MNDKSEQSDNRKNDRLSTGSKATIGESVLIVGDVTGKEDLVVNGNIEGDINFREHNIYIGEKGRINANVTAKNISVEGDVKGELRASEQVTIKPSGRVTGDIRAPRVVLDDGCQFKGSVDMEEMHTSSDNRTPKLKLTGINAPHNPSLPREHPIKTAKKPGKL